MNKNFFSIIIPVRKKNKYLDETAKKLNNIAYKNFELIVVTDNVMKKAKQNIDPASKRNYGSKIAKGNILAFLDDDSYPSRKWLNNANYLFIKKKIQAIAGPTLTPKSDSYKKQASGLVLSSFLGSGGAGIYRNTVQKSRYVDDYPTVNLLVRKSAFEKVGGFSKKYWPGEDTLFCLSLINKFGPKSILYHPKIIVYHHRRNIGLDFLMQISRYGLHRGYFAKIYPKNSAKIGYILPSLFFIYIVLLVLGIFSPAVLFIYITLLIIQLIIFKTKHNLKTSLIATLYIPITHLTYGYHFILGYFGPDLRFKAHKISKKTGEYIGG